MDIKKRIEEVVRNGTLQSGEEITYIETDDLYAIFDAIANSSNDIQNIIPQCRTCKHMTNGVCDKLSDRDGGAIFSVGASQYWHENYGIMPHDDFGCVLHEA